MRIQAERQARPAPSLAEQLEARRLRRLDRQLGEFTSVASVYTAEEEEEAEVRLLNL